MIAMLAVMALAAPPATAGPSFSCARAASQPERAICSTPALARLDRRVAHAYAEAVRSLSIDPKQPPMPVVSSQRAWLAERDRCGGDAGCLRRAMERRLAILQFAPEPGARAPIDPYVGRFRYSAAAGEATVLRLSPRTAFVRITTSEPTEARWLCDVAGVLETGPAGAVLRQDGGPRILVRATPRGLVVRSGEASPEQCGLNGTFSGDFVR